MSDSFQPHGLQHARLPCPSVSPWSLLKLMSLESTMLYNHLILCGPLLLLPSITPSIGVFSSESTLCIRWPKYWSLVHLFIKDLFTEHLLCSRHPLRHLGYEEQSQWAQHTLSKHTDR